MRAKQIKKRLEEMYQAQLKLTDMILPKWRKQLKKYNFESAVITEVGEALESAGYKWWKKNTIDKDNIKIELIDILHFMLNKLYYEPNAITDEFDYFVHGLQIKTREDLIKKLTELGKHQGMFDLAVCFNIMEMPFEEIYKTYMTKYTLNMFRKENGYDKGTYIKIWGEVEDNVVATELANSLDIGEDFTTQLKTALTEYYNTKVKNEEDNSSNSTSTTDSSNNEEQ